MPNIASVLKDEIARIARKEIRSQTDPLRKAAAAYRSEIAALKRRSADLERALKRQLKAGSASAKIADEGAEDSPAHRFSAKGLKSHRERLGLSAADFGLLVGSSGQSVYKWEEGEGRPRAKYMPAITAVRAMGKREVAARLEELTGAGGVASAAEPKKPRRKAASAAAPAGEAKKPRRKVPAKSASAGALAAKKAPRKAAAKSAEESTPASKRAPREKVAAPSVEAQ